MIVLPGVTIGNGSVIGAGSIVTRSISEHSLAVGNPHAASSAKLIERAEKMSEELPGFLL